MNTYPSKVKKLETEIRKKKGEIEHEKLAQLSGQLEYVKAMVCEIFNCQETMQA